MYLLFSFSWVLFSFSNFFSSSFQPLLLLVFSYMVLFCRYCCLEGLRSCMENENILIFLCLGHPSPPEIILFLDINSFVSFYPWCIFVPMPMLTYFLCSECILLKLDLNVISISEEWNSFLWCLSLVNSHVWRMLYSTNKIRQDFVNFVSVVY